MTALDLVEERLAAAGCNPRRRGDRIEARCPAHEDSTPSLTIGAGTSQPVVLRCHAGCDPPDIVRVLGLELADLCERTERPEPDPVVATYIYDDENGKPLFRVRRTAAKKFFQQRRDGAKWVNGLGDTERVLYRLPGLLRGVALGDTVWLAEGEKDADRMAGEGLVASCNPGGAGKWRDEYCDHLVGAEVVIVADDDKVGRKHAEAVAKSLRVHDIAAKVVLPAAGCKDASDHFAAGHGLDDFRATTTAPAVQRSDDVDTFDDIPEEPGHVVLDAVRDWLSDHVAYASDHHAPTVALWAAHTHALDRASSTGRLAFTSPEPESGKTRNLELLELITHKGKLVLQMSPASLFRWVDAIRPTILFDEYDAVFGPAAAKEHEDLRALINAGHRPGATVPRVETPSMRVVEFKAYAAVAVAGIGALPDTIRSRAIIVPMRRRGPDETVRPYRERVTRPEGEALCRRIAAWVERHGEEIPEAPEMPEGVTDRQGDIWEALVAIADAAGGHWPETARAACKAIVGKARANADDQSLGIRLLADIRSAFDNADRISTARLLTVLHGMEQAPWGDLRGNPITARWLATRLKPYAITPRDVRFGDATLKGYLAEDFHEAWQRYLPKGNRGNMGNDPGSDVAHVAPVADTRAAGNAPMTTTDRGICRVCDQAMRIVEPGQTTHPSCANGRVPAAASNGQSWWSR